MVTINDKTYYTVKDFARLTNKTEQTIRKLYNIGNRIRKLKGLYIANRLFILTSELTEYPFTVSGRNSRTVYHYDQEGVIINAK